MLVFVAFSPPIFPRPPARHEGASLGLAGKAVSWVWLAGPDERTAQPCSSPQGDQLGKGRELGVRGNQHRVFHHCLGRDDAVKGIAVDRLELTG